MITSIGNYEIGNGRCFIIAEIGNNHNGDIDCAINMIDQAIEMKADCVKFQMRHLEEVYRERTLQKKGEDLGTEYVLDLLKRFELSTDEHKIVSDYCKENGILYLCTPWDHKSIHTLESFNVAAYKTASADLTNLPLLDAICKTGKPVIVSTGMSTYEEIINTVRFLEKHSHDFILLHCNSTYPAPIHDIKLRSMETLRDLHPLVGYSGHERGIIISLAARALNACVIERHFTLDRNMEGPDHAASLEFKEFKDLIEGIREIESALGNDANITLSQGEMINRENLAKSLVATKNIKSGHVIQAEDITVKSPGQGISPQRYEELIGRKIQRDMVPEDYFYPSDLLENRLKPRQYAFKRPWGIPIRYHDFSDYEQQVKPDIFEFHLSYSDMDLKPDDFLHGEYSNDFVVHAPELFSGSHLMDLTSPDKKYRRRSITETQRVIDITRTLNKYFPKTKRPMIVANIGGFSMDEPIPKKDKYDYYLRFEESLQDLDLDSVELTPQTMAPFPWHFGGQRYQNLFVEIDEILEWCVRLNLRMCYDVSHSSLTCEHYGYNFYEFSEKISPITAHLHLGDARGVNGEGLQIGDGDIDFVRLGKILTKGCPEASFIPEIWQGHKNRGEGFWVALESLEKLL